MIRLLIKYLHCLIDCELKNVYAVVVDLLFNLHLLAQECLIAKFMFDICTKVEWYLGTDKTTYKVC